MRKTFLWGATLLLLGLALLLGWEGRYPAEAQPLAGLTPTHTPTPTFTPTPTSTPTATPTPTPTPSPPPSTPPAPEEARLEASKEADRALVAPGESVVFSIIVENVGTVAVTGVTIVDDLPQELEVLDATVTQGEVTVEGNRVVATVGVLGPGYTAALTITARVRPGVPPGTQIENVTVISSDQTGEIPVRAVITVPGLLPESGVSGRPAIWVGMILILIGAGVLVLGLHRR